MNNENEQHKAEEEIAQMARDIGQPLPGDLKKRIMDKVHERARELTQTPQQEPVQTPKPRRERKRGRGMQP
jgi:hypothetical protein